MRSRTIVVALAGSSAAFCSANGADLPVPAPVAPIVYNSVGLGPWSGFYFGGNFGSGWASTNSAFTLTGNGSNGTIAGVGTTLQGPNGGLQVGYNWQIGNLLAGVEGDVQAADQNQTSTFFCGAACSITENAQLQSFGTLRGRVGFTITDVLFYGTGGLNWTHGENSFNGTLNGINASLADFTHDSLGWVVGGGIEWMFWYGFSTKIEYLYLQNNSSNSTIPVSAALGGGTLTDTAKASNNVVRVGVNYHFSTGGWPYGR